MMQFRRVKNVHCCNRKHAFRPYAKKDSSSCTNVMLATPTAFVQDGDPAGKCDRAPCVDAPQIMNDGELPPVQQTSASLLFQSHPGT